MEDVQVTITTSTMPVSQEGFGMPLIFDPKNDTEYQEITELPELTGYVDGDIPYEMAQAMLSQNPSPAKIAVFGVDIGVSGNTVSDELDTLAIEHEDYYFILIASRTTIEQDSGADWAAANGKLAIIQPDITTTVGDIVTTAGTYNSTRNIIEAHNGGTAGVDPFADAAMVGRIAPIQPGGTTWKFKQLEGIPVATYTNAEVSTLLDANVNTIVKKGGIIQTNEGLTTGGGFADVTRGKDYLTARITEAIQALLYNAEKVPYDDNGIAQVVGKLKGVLKRAVADGLIARDEDGNGIFTVSFPRRADIATNDLANRILPDIKFTATIAGAIHNVQITGVLEV